MKKTVMFFILILFTLIALPHAYGATVRGEEMVMPISAPAQVFSGSEPVPPPPVTEEGIAKAVLKKLGNLPRDLKKFLGKDSETAKAIKVFSEKQDTKTAQAISDMKAEIQKKDTATGKAIESVKSNDDANMATILLPLAAFFILIVAAFFLSRITRKKNKPVTTSNLSNQLTELDRSIKKSIRESQKVVEGRIDEVPAKTAQEVNKFDASPIVFEIKANGENHNVSYSAAGDGFYWTLKVFEIPDGKDHPETFERQMETKRGVAKSYIAGMVKKYIEGKLKGKIEETLIEYLLKTGELKIEKIS